MRCRPFAGQERPLGVRRPSRMGRPRRPPGLRLPRRAARKSLAHGIRPPFGLARLLLPLCGRALRRRHGRRWRLREHRRSRDARRRPYVRRFRRRHLGSSRARCLKCTRRSARRPRRWSMRHRKCMWLQSHTLHRSHVLPQSCTKRLGRHPRWCTKRLGGHPRWCTKRRVPLRLRVLPRWSVRPRQRPVLLRLRVLPPKCMPPPRRVRRRPRVPRQRNTKRSRGNADVRKRDSRALTCGLARSRFGLEARFTCSDLRPRAIPLWFGSGIHVL